MLTVVPGGTTNMTALDLGLCGSPESILHQLRESLQKQVPPVLLQRHVLCIEQAGAAKVYGMFFAVGLIARAVIFSQSKIKQLGITGEIYSGIITLGYLVGRAFGTSQRGMGPGSKWQLSRKMLSCIGDSSRFFLPAPSIACYLACGRTGGRSRSRCM